MSNDLSHFQAKKQALAEKQKVREVRQFWSFKFHQGITADQRLEKVVGM